MGRRKPFMLAAAACLPIMGATGAEAARSWTLNIVNARRISGETMAERVLR
ncbi:MAG: hypothetical protein L0H73_17540 [Nitrococcus sp.]|nr:hypothetical protein [Nitrococcus sp.]